MRLILIRHGQPDVPTTGSSSNPPLSMRGHEHARCAAVVLQKEPIQRIISSGMRRADATAQPLADALGLPIEIHPDLGEVDRWGGAYCSIEMIRSQGREEWQRFLDAPLEYFGVDAVRFRQETLAAFENILHKPPMTAPNVETDAKQTLAIFTHGFPINLLLARVLGIQNDARFVPFYGSISRLTGKSLDSMTVVSINETGHIPEALR